MYTRRPVSGSVAGRAGSTGVSRFARHCSGESLPLWLFSSSLPTSHSGQRGTFRAHMSVLSLVPPFSAHPWGPSKGGDCPTDLASQLPSEQRGNLQLQGSTSGSQQNPLHCANICTAAQKAQRKGVVDSLHQPRDMQAPRRLWCGTFSRGNLNSNRNRETCTRGARRRLLHAQLSMCMPGCTALLPWLPLRQICPIYLGLSVGIFPLRGFHCSPGAGRVSRTGFWSKQGSLVEMQLKAFWKCTMEEEF